MDLSIVICTYNRACFLSLGLKAILDQIKLFNNYKIEIVVVDNNSSDSTSLVVQEFKNKFPSIEFLYYLERRQGISFSRNSAIKFAKGQFIAFVDDDAVVNTHWLSSLVDAIETKNAQVYGGPIFPNFEIPCPKWIDENYFARIFKKHDGFLTGLSAIEGFPGGNVCFNKEIFDAIGVFDTSLGMSGNAMGLGEEPDLFNRLYYSSYQARIYNVNLMCISHFEGRAKLDRLYLKERIHLSGLQFSHRFRSQYKVGGTLLVFMKILKQFLSSLVFLIQRPFYPSSKFKFLKCIWLIKGLWKGVFIS